MSSRTCFQVARRLPIILTASRTSIHRSRAQIVRSPAIRQPSTLSQRSGQFSLFHSSRSLSAQSPTADAFMENLNDLYATAKDEFEIAAEETEKKTVYAADDREAAREALETLKDAFERASKESDPEVAKEVQSRVGPRIRELEHAVIAMEERAMED